MKEGFRQSMAWLHTWSGLLVGWVLLLIFMAGTSSYYREEITLWMKPELHGAAIAAATPTVAAEQAVRALQRRAPKSERWFITLPSEREPAVQTTWAPPAGEPKGKGRRRFDNAQLDPATGAELAGARATRGGDFFYRLHFDLHYMPVPWARWIVGACAMSMLVAILSGIVTHKRIFKDFFTFRPRKGQRSWLDFHNVSAVLALPFHLMITYTGLVTLMFMYMPWGVKAAYNDDNKAFFAELFPNGAADAKASGTAARLTPLGPVIAHASQAWGGAPVGRVTVNHPNDAAATIAVSQQSARGLSSDLPTLHYDGVTGRPLGAPAATRGAAAETRGVMYGLHIASFADPLVRALFFVSGLAGCAMVATGLLLWAVKERPKHLKAGRIGFGLRLVDGLNIGAVAGLPVAMAAYFWANRLLPAGLAERPAAEISWFFAAWGVALACGLAWPARPMWRLQLLAGGALFALLPALNGATGGAHLLVSIPNGLWALAGFDGVALAIGATLLYAAARLGRSPVTKTRLAGNAA
nr:PepSY domain-containing protein [uncultured Duganella sp.]